MLIDTLRQQHKELIQLIGRVDVALKLGMETGVLAALSSLCQALRVHVALEDQEIYPGLSCALELGGDLKPPETVSLFSSNMKRIIESLQDFLSRHEASFHLERFRVCWNTLGAVLFRRIEAEERTLYPLYERCVLTNTAISTSDAPSFAGAVPGFLAGKRLADDAGR